MNIFQKQIIITYNDLTVSKFREGTLAFTAVANLFIYLFRKERPTKDEINSEEMQNILRHVQAHDIKEIEFNNHRKYQFEIEIINGVKGYKIECKELRQDLESAVEAIRGNPNVKIVGGTLKDLEDLEEREGDKLPEHLREIINYIKRVRAEKTAEITEQHIHEASTVQH